MAVAIGEGAEGAGCVMFAIGEGAEGARCVMFAIGKSRRVFYVFLKAPIANHSDPNPLKYVASAPIILTREPAPLWLGLIRREGND